jgi:hypothetical protein
MNWIEEKIAQIEQETYGSDMPASNKALLRKQLEKEDRFWVHFDRDHINGFDDSEPQTSADYERTAPNRALPVLPSM